MFSGNILHAEMIFLSFCYNAAKFSIMEEAFKKFYSLLSAVLLIFLHPSLFDKLE